MFWVIAAVVAVVLAGAWLWADRRQPPGSAEGDRARDRARLQHWDNSANSDGPRGL